MIFRSIHKGSHLSDDNDDEDDPKKEEGKSDNLMSTMYFSVPLRKANEDRWDEDEAEAEVEDTFNETEICVTCGETPCCLEGYKSEIYFAKHYVNKHDRLSQASTDNKESRFAEYSKFISMVYGIVGKGSRIPLPIFIEMHFKDLWPNKEGESYTGFQEQNISDDETEHNIDKTNNTD